MGHVFHIAHVAHKTCFAMDIHFGDTACIAAQHRHFTGHGFERCQTETLRFGGHDEQIADAQDFFYRFLLTQESHLVAGIQFAADLLHVAALRSVADQQQPGRHGFSHTGKNPDHVFHAFHLAEITRMHQDALAIRRDGLLEMLFRFLRKAGEIDEVRNDTDIALDMEIGISILFQALRNRRHTIAVVDTPAHYRLECGFAAYQCDIGAMQGGNDRDIDSLFL